MEVTLNQLRVFREVARQEHFGRAAEALFVSPPAVSKTIKDLERQVGLPLFEQVARRTRLTDAGAVLVSYVERVLTELGDADAALATLRGGDGGRLVIGASSTPGIYILPEHLGAFRKEHPRVEVALEISDTREVLERVSDGRLDLGVVGETEFPANLVAECLWEDALVLVLSPAHPLAQRKGGLTLAALTEEAFVLRERGSSTRQVMERALKERGFYPKVAMELGNTEAVKRSVGAGLGIAFMSDHAVALERKAGLLASREVRGLDLRRGFYLVRRASFHLAPLHQRFLAVLGLQA